MLTHTHKAIRLAFSKGRWEMFKPGTWWLCLLAGDAACPTISRPIHSSERIFSCYSRDQYISSASPGPHCPRGKRAQLLHTEKAHCCLAFLFPWSLSGAPGLQLVSISVCPWFLTPCGSEQSCGACSGQPVCQLAQRTSVFSFPCKLQQPWAHTAKQTGVPPHSWQQRQTSHMFNGNRYWWKNTFFILCQLASPYINQRGKNKTAAAWAFIGSSLPLSFGNAASTQLSHEYICHWKH